jgi:uncharacterized protein
MSNAKPPAARSLDTILASIRRFIADAKPVTAAPGGAAADAVDEDVLELTEAIADDGSMRHLAPFGSPPTVSGREPIISAAPTSAASAAFRRLTAVDPNEKKLACEPQLQSDSVTDDLLSERLRPLLQAWLDAHLPVILERLVADEIARISGRFPPSAGD